jgi:hypothetical protein
MEYGNGYQNGASRGGYGGGGVRGTCYNCTLTHSPPPLSFVRGGACTCYVNGRLMCV